MIPLLLRRVADGWDPTVGPAPTSATLLGVDRAPDARVTLLLFAGDARPVAVAKVARTPAGEAGLQAEHVALCHFWAGATPWLRRAMPRPLGLHRVDGRRVLVQTAVPGRPMTIGYYTPGHVSSHRHVEADFAAAARWLAMFQRDTAATAVDVEEATERWVRPLLARYRERIGWGEAERRLIEPALDRARALRDERVPVTGRHGDFWMGNLMVAARDGVAAVDWEHAAAQGVPLGDVYKFPTSYAFYLDRSRPWGGGRVRGHPERVDHSGRWRRYGDWPNLVGFRHAYFSRGWFPDVVRAYVRAAQQRLGVHPGLTLLFFVAFLAEQALASQTDDFRRGYRSLMAALAEERGATWLWADC